MRSISPATPQLGWGHVVAIRSLCWPGLGLELGPGNPPALMIAGLGHLNMLSFILNKGRSKCSRLLSCGDTTANAGGEEYNSISHALAGLKQILFSTEKGLDGESCKAHALFP